MSPRYAATGRYAPPEERLHRRLERKSNGCLEWTGGTHNGYGQITINRIPVPTHRLAWELEHGPIPPGLCVLHHCDNPPCCDAVDTEHHLFLGTQAENLADRDAKGRNGHSIKTHCKRGHAFDEENTYLRPRGGRGCRACTQESRLRYQERLRGEADEQDASILDEK